VGREEGCQVGANRPSQPGEKEIGSQHSPKRCRIMGEEGLAPGLAAVLMSAEVVEFAEGFG
jgi:hypothetical protein